VILFDESSRIRSGIRGQKRQHKAVILPIEEYEELLEDLYDLGAIASQRK